MSGKLFSIIILESAERDLIEIFEYLENERGIDFAATFVFEIKNAIETLKTFPERGHLIEELSKLGDLDYRKIQYQHFLIIYRIKEQKVIVALIADGRRDMQNLLHNRIIRLKPEI